MTELNPVTPTVVTPTVTPPYYHCLTYEEFDLPCRLPEKQFESFIVGTKTLESTGVKWEVYAQSKPLHVAFLLRSADVIPPRILDVEAKVQVINSQDIVVQDRQGGAVLSTGYYQMKPSWILWSRLPNQTATIMCKFKIITKDFPPEAFAASPYLPPPKPGSSIQLPPAESEKPHLNTTTEGTEKAHSPADAAKLNHIETVYRDLLETGSFGSIKIVTNLETIDAHEPILYSQGNFQNFTTNRGGSEGPVLEIKDFEEEVIGAMLEFLYTGWTEMAVEQPLVLMEIANVYGVERLQDLCWTHVLEQLSIESVIAALVAAEKYKLDQERLKKLVDFFLGNLVTVATTREIEFKVFEKDTRDLFRKLNKRGDMDLKDVIEQVPLSTAAAAVAARPPPVNPPPGRKSTSIARVASMAKRKSSTGSRISAGSSPSISSTSPRASNADGAGTGSAAPSQTDVEPGKSSAEQEESKK